MAPTPNWRKQARGIDVRSAIRTVRNRRWPKQKGNDGKVRALVPSEFLDAKRHDPPKNPPEIPPEITAKISRVEGRIEALTEQLERECGRADGYEAELRAVREQVVGLREERAAALARADELRAVVDRLTAWPGAGAWARLRDLVGRARYRR